MQNDVGIFLLLRKRRDETGGGKGIHPDISIYKIFLCIVL